MKKVLLAFVLCLAVCFCTCTGMADPELPQAVWQVDGVTSNLTTHDPIHIAVTIDGAEDTME